jgi:hypothetical protein
VTEIEGVPVVTLERAIREGAAGTLPRTCLSKPSALGANMGC